MRRGLGILAAITAVLGPAPGAAQAQQQPTFQARVDRTQLTVGEMLTYEATLTGGEASRYQAPEFKGFRVLGTMGPNKMTSMSGIFGGQMTVQTIVSWQYRLQAVQKGNLSIGPARVQVGSRELRTASVAVAVGEASAPPPMMPANSAGAAAADAPNPPPMTGAQKPYFLRVVPKKTKVYVGEQVVVSWYFYGVDQPRHFDVRTEPRTDDFWREDLPVPNNRNPLLPPTHENVGGRDYEVSPLFNRALFPLKAGKLTVGPMEAEIAQIEFPAMLLRTQKLKTDPLIIDAQPLPKGAPAGFDPANVGNITLAVRIDRSSMQTGEAATITIEAKGQGNVRKWQLPKMPRLDGWKVYEPRTSANVEPGTQVTGSKVTEILLVPERPGTTVIPSLEMPYFDPETGRYHVEKTEPVPILVGGDGTVASTSAKPSGAPTENVLDLEIRPAHNQPRLYRDLGTTFYRSQVFIGFVLAPPLALALVALAGRIRERLAEDTQGARRRRVRRLVRRRLRSARNHLSDGETAKFFIEIERVLREVLSARLGRPVTGLRQDELRDALLGQGVATELVDRTLAELEDCDRARFAPGDVGNDDMVATLDRAGELILSIEKTRMREAEVAP